MKSYVISYASQILGTTLTVKGMNVSRVRGLPSMKYVNSKTADRDLSYMFDPFEK